MREFHQMEVREKGNDSIMWRIYVALMRFRHRELEDNLLEQTSFDLDLYKVERSVFGKALADQNGAQKSSRT